MRAFDYFALNNNNVDNGDTNDYSTPKNKNDISNNLDGSKLSASREENKYSFNPLIPGNSKDYGKNDQTQTGDDKKDDDSSSSQGNNGNQGSNSGNSTKSEVLSIKEALINFFNSNTQGGNVNATSFNGQKVNVQSNESDATPSAEGSESAASQSKSSASPDSSSGESDSVSKKAYEIDEKNENKFIPSIFFIIPVLILLFIGVRRRKSNLD